MVEEVVVVEAMKEEEVAKVVVEKVKAVVEDEG